MFSPKEEFSAQSLQRVRLAAPSNPCSGQGQVSHWAAAAPVGLAPHSCTLGEPARRLILPEQGLRLNLELDGIHGLKLNAFVPFMFF